MQTNESQTNVWLGFKVIGIINIVLYALGCIASLIFVYLMIAYGHDDPEFKLNKRSTTIVYIILALNFLMSIVGLYINYGLVNQKATNYGSKVKQWLVFHTMIIVTYIAFVIITVIMDGDFKRVSLYTGSNIALVLETIIVAYFYKQMPSDNTGNQSTNV